MECNLARGFVCAVGLVMVFCAAAIALDLPNFKTCNITEIVEPSALCAESIGYHANCSADTNIPCQCGRECAACAPCVLVWAYYGQTVRQIEPIPGAGYLCVNAEPICPRGELEEDRRAAYAPPAGRRR